MLVRGSGIRDIAAVLEMHPVCVLYLLQMCCDKLPAIRPQKRHYKEVQIDELWTWVGQRKKGKLWLFYAYCPAEKQIIAFQWGNRSRKTAQKLYAQLDYLEIDRFCTDKWKSFRAVLPPDRHLVGKQYTTAIEGVNTSLRVKNRRLMRQTPCFSKSEKYHKIVMHLVIFYFNCVHHTF